MSARSPDPPVFDPDRLPLLVGDLSMELEILRDFIAQGPEWVRSVEQAACHGDGPELDKPAHLLMGSALQITGTALATACRALVTKYTPATTPLEFRLATLRSEHARLREAVLAYLAARS